MDTPQYARVNGKLYKINTSYKVALKCNEVARDDSVGYYEKELAIIYMLFGDEGLKDKGNHDKLMSIALKYLSCGEEPDGSNEEPDMDFKQDFRLIKASFMSDYGIDISKQDLSWYDFYTYLNGLTDNCVLNRVRELRTFDESKISDTKEKRKITRAKKRFALQKHYNLTKEQEESLKRINEIMGI